MVNLNFFLLFRITVYSTHEMTFQDTGLFYFYLDKHDTGTDWLNDQGNLICAVRVTQVNRFVNIYWYHKYVLLFSKEREVFLIDGMFNHLIMASGTTDKQHLVSIYLLSV